ncbi:MAG: redox-regulated ATPase YchF [Rickettsiaceae bacterium]
MTLKCGIVGLPNIGKSTLFNALTAKSGAMVANYPFCTIDPNSGIVDVPNKKLDILARIAQSAKQIPACIEFVDIAGLVKGASKGEGLGNQFLANIREVDAIIHVVRCFEDTNITHVHNEVNPIDDIETINTELIISDYEQIDRRIHKVEKKAKSGDKEAQELYDILKDLYYSLSQNIPARALSGKYGEKFLFQLGLLTSKPVLYVCNVLESEAVNGNEFTQLISKITDNYVVVSAKIEHEISLLDNNQDKEEFLQSLDLKETGLNKIISASYKLLNLQDFFTVGPKEAKCWPVLKNTTAYNAAAMIHTDIQRGFIRAEVISYDDYVRFNGEVKAKESGKMRLEGKDYALKDGDVVHFRFNV